MVAMYNYHSPHPRKTNYTHIKTSLQGFLFSLYQRFQFTSSAKLSKRRLCDSNVVLNTKHELSVSTLFFVRAENRTDRALTA